MPNSLVTQVQRTDIDQSFQLRFVGKERMEVNIYKFTFEFPNPEWYCGIWPGGYLSMIAYIDGKKIKRSYTPINTMSTQGKIDFYIK